MKKPAQVKIGTILRLRHKSTGQYLCSYPKPYRHPGTSGQQMIVASLEKNEETLWIVIGPHSSGENRSSEYGLKHGDVVRFEHQVTGRYLHSHGDRLSPISKQQEVTAHGDRDLNDDWRVEIEGNGAWEFGKPVRLIHVITNRPLHSHVGHSDLLLTSGEQEVTCFDGRDDNDLWLAEEPGYTTPFLYDFVSLLRRRRFEKLQIAFAVLGLLVALLAQLFQHFNREKLRAQNLTYERQLEVLDQVQSSISNLKDFVNTQRKQLQDQQAVLEELKSEKQKLQPVVEANKQTVEAIFRIQAERNRAKVWIERLIAFVLGVASSLVASAIYSTVRLRRSSRS